MRDRLRNRSAGATIAPTVAETIASCIHCVSCQPGNKCDIMKPRNRKFCQPTSSVFCQALSQTVVHILELYVGPLFYTANHTNRHRNQYRV